MELVQEEHSCHLTAHLDYLRADPFNYHIPIYCFSFFQNNKEISRNELSPYGNSVQ